MVRSIERLFDELYAKVQANIDRHGRTVMNVFPSSTEAKKAKTTKKAKATKAAAKKREPGALNAVVARVLAMMQRKNGATMKEMVDETGIEAHPMRAKIKQAREHVGLTIDSPLWQAPSKENGGRYRILESAPVGKDVAAQQAPEAS